MKSNLKSPVYVQVEITSNCNNECLHCYNFWNYGTEIRRNNLSIADWQKIAKILGDNEIFYVTITGGEPFLEKEKTYSFIDSLIEQNVRVMINSNATLITKNDAKKISEYPIESFLTSLLSADEKLHNRIASSKSAFQQTTNGISLLTKNGVNLAVNMVALKLNYRDIYRTGKWLHDEFGLKNFSATPVCPSANKHKNLELSHEEIFEVLNQLVSLRQDFGMNIDVLEALPKCFFIDYAGTNSSEIIKTFSKRMCTAGNTTITIGSEGDMRACSFDHQSHGNVLKEDFRLIWNNMGMWRNNSFLPKECVSCFVSENCSGGCRVNSKVKKGNYCEPDYLSKNIIKEEQAVFFEEKLPNVSMTSKMSLVPNIRFRQEKESIFLVIADSMRFIITNEKGLKVIKCLSELKYFIPKNVAVRFNLDYEFSREFFKELFSKGFLVYSE
jgi:radical SAM protein with 4Fe4S-binding SPASM domain